MEQAMIASSDSEYLPGEPETCRENPTKKPNLWVKSYRIKFQDSAKVSYHTCRKKTKPKFQLDAGT